MKKPKTIYEDGLTCGCGGVMKAKSFNVEGFSVRGWQCEKCSRIDYSDDISAILAAKRLRKEGARLRLRRVGQTVVLTIPKDIREALHLKPGENIRLYPVSHKKMMIEVQ